MSNKKFNKFTDAVYFFASIFLIALLLVVLFFSLKYSLVKLNSTDKINEISYYLAIIIAFVTVIVEWIDGRIKAIIRITNKGGKNGKRKDQYRAY